MSQVWRPPTLLLQARWLQNIPMQSLPHANDTDARDDFSLNEIASDCVVPVHVPSDPEQNEHVGSGAEAFYRCQLSFRLTHEAQTHAGHVRT